MKMITPMMVVMVVTFLVLSKTEITFQPFSIKCEQPLTGAGWMLIIVGAMLLSYDSYRVGHRSAEKQIEKELNDHLKKWEMELRELTPENNLNENNSQQGEKLQKSI